MYTDQCQQRTGFLMQGGTPKYHVDMDDFTLVISPVDIALTAVQ